MVARRVKGGFRLFSKKGKALGPVRRTKKATQKDERRVQFFVNLQKSRGGRGSLRSKVRMKSLTRNRRKRGRSSRGSRR